ncbi:unnamed protein product, partial [Didymodactylos carnosus]
MTNNHNNTNNNISKSLNGDEEVTLEIPVWVQGKRKWVTGITKKTTFDDLIYALLQQADLLTNNNGISGFAIAECIQIVSSSLSSKDNTPSINDSLVTQRIIKGRLKVMKSFKNWQFDKLPLTILQLITTKQSSIDNKFRTKVKKFLSTKTLTTNQSISSSFSETSIPYTLGIVKPTLPKLSQSSSSSPISSQQQLNELYECSNVLERQQRLLNYLDEKIHQTQYNVLSYEQLPTAIVSSKRQNDIAIDNTI